MLVTSDSGNLPHGTKVKGPAEKGPPDPVPVQYPSTTIIHLTNSGNPDPGAESTYSFTRQEPTDAFGWIGSQQSIDQMQAVIKNFTSNTPANGLGKYFETPDGTVYGYPEFFNPVTTFPASSCLRGRTCPC